jgi:hypothetical protein
MYLSPTLNGNSFGHVQTFMLQADTYFYKKLKLLLI